MAFVLSLLKVCAVVQHSMWSHSVYWWCHCVAAEMLAINCAHLSILHFFLTPWESVQNDWHKTSRLNIMRTKHLSVLIHIRTKGEVGIIKHVKALQWFLLFCWRFPGGVSFVDPICYLCFMFVFALLSCLFLAALLSPAGKRAYLLAFLCVVFSCVFVSFPNMYGVPGQMWKLIVSVLGLCLPLYLCHYMYTGTFQLVFSVKLIFHLHHTTTIRSHITEFLTVFFCYSSADTWKPTGMKLFKEDLNHIKIEFICIIQKLFCP